jgi:hypothetical protein
MATNDHFLPHSFNSTLSTKVGGQTSPVLSGPDHSGTNLGMIFSSMSPFLLFLLALTSTISTSLSSSLPQGRVILTIFAGRRQFLEILRGYLDVLLDQQLIDEIHLWDFTRDFIDQKYLTLLERSHEKYKIIHKMGEGLLTEDNRLENWLSFYRYYSSGENLRDEDILIKCDDDIVYLDLESFQHFLTVVRTQSSSHLPSAPPSLPSAFLSSPLSSSPECNLFFPNIVNNDVCAYLQTQSLIHNLLPASEISEDAFEYANPDPLTGYTQYVSWFLNPTKALEIHSDFLSNPKKYRSMTAPSTSSSSSSPSSDTSVPPSSTPIVIPWYSRISINFFGAMGANIRHSFSLLIENSQDDERFLTSEIIPILHKSNCIVPSFVVSHFSFHGQRNSYLEWGLRGMLPQYYELLIQNLEPHLGNTEAVKAVRGLKLKKMNPDISLYREIYGPIVLMDDLDDEDKQSWTDDLRTKIFSNFGFQESDHSLLELELSDDSLQSCVGQTAE